MIYLPSSQYVALIERKSEIKYQNKVFSIRWRSSSLPITIGSSLPEEFKLPSDWKHSQHISDIHDFFYMKTFCRIVFGSLITWKDQPFEERGCSSVCLTAPVIHSHHEGGNEATSRLLDFYWGGIDTISTHLLSLMDWLRRYFWKTGLLFTIIPWHWQHPILLRWHRHFLIKKIIFDFCK